MADGAEWGRIVAESGGDDLDDLATRSAERAAAVRRFADGMDRGGRSSTRIYGEVLAAAASGQIQRELRNLLRVDEDRRARAVSPRPARRRNAASGVGGRGVAVSVVAFLVGVIGPVLLFRQRRGPGYIAELDDVAVLAGLLSVAAAIWFAFVEPRRAKPQLSEPPVFVILGIVTALGFVALVRRVADGQPLDTLPRAAALTLFLAATTIYGVGFVQSRRRHPSPQGRGERSTAAVSSAPEAVARLAEVDDDLRRELHSRRERIAPDQWPDPATVLLAVRVLFERGQLDSAEAQGILGELF